MGNAYKILVGKSEDLREISVVGKIILK